jgi:hypothetical protein
MTENQTPEPEPELHSYTVVPCPSCGSPLPLHMSGAFAVRLAEAGIEPEKVAQAVARGLMSREIQCQRCAVAALN